MFQRSPVGYSPEFLRIKSLPVRSGAAYPANLVAEMTRLLRTTDGEQTLHEHQARALYDLGTHKRGFFPMRVGSGKTLVTFLAPRVLGSRRPVLLLPAALVQKTERELVAAGKHWQVSRQIKILSYEICGRVQGAQKLDLYKPDLLMTDEAHKLKNPKAAVTRRVARYMGANQSTIFVPLTGSIMKDSIKDYAHLMRWAMRDQCPMPIPADDLEQWANALDEGLNIMARRSPGVLLDLHPLDEPFEDGGEIARARKIFFARTNATAGIVSADTATEYTGSLLIEAVEYTPNAKTIDNFATLRSTMCRPDGWALSDAMQQWRVARELALGLHYTWDPLPPVEWLEARKQYAKLVRDTLKAPISQKMGWDSELQITTAILNGVLNDQYGLLQAWRNIKPTFDVNSVPVWHDETALRLCGDWLADHPKGICWSEHRFFARTLSKMTGIPYFGAKGLDDKDNFIQDATGPIIASIAANSTGRNLQEKWCDNLLTAALSDSERLEQLCGRTHRFGQKADSVTLDVLVACREHGESIPRALSSSIVKKDLLGFNQKLMLADINWPDDFCRRTGPQWA